MSHYRNRILEHFCEEIDGEKLSIKMYMDPLGFLNRHIITLESRRWVTKKVLKMECIYFGNPGGSITHAISIDGMYRFTFLGEEISSHDYNHTISREIASYKRKEDLCKLFVIEIVELVLKDKSWTARLRERWGPLEPTDYAAETIEEERRGIIKLLTDAKEEKFFWVDSPYAHIDWDRQCAIINESAHTGEGRYGENEIREAFDLAGKLLLRRLKRIFYGRINHLLCLPGPDISGCHSDEIDKKLELSKELFDSLYGCYFQDIRLGQIRKMLIDAMDGLLEAEAMKEKDPEGREHTRSHLVLPSIVFAHSLEELFPEI